MSLNITGRLQTCSIVRGVAKSRNEEQLKEHIADEANLYKCIEEFYKYKKSTRAPHEFQIKMKPGDRSAVLHQNTYIIEFLKGSRPICSKSGISEVECKDLQDLMVNLDSQTEDQKWITGAKTVELPKIAGIESVKGKNTEPQYEKARTSPLRRKIKTSSYG